MKLNFFQKNKKNNIPTIVITSLYLWSYFQIFLLGLYELEKQKKIKLKFRAGLIFWISTLPFTIPGLNRLKQLFQEDSYMLEGYIINNGIKKTFCIDSADAPFLFSSKHLQLFDFYFKMQCPKDLNVKQGFKLGEDVYIKYCDHQHINETLKLTERGERKENGDILLQNLNKVFPLLSGFRRISKSNSYKMLKSGITHYAEGRENQVSKKLMCYFGNALGPKEETELNNPDWDWEGDIMGYYKGKLEHPNVKRAKVANILAAKGIDYDARIISNCNADNGKIERKDLIIPLNDFCKHISSFEYNMNISGYRMSIPSRFIESFIVGTAILTDKLSVKWFQPFEEEVVETEEMGYLLDEQINWNKVDLDIISLPKVNKQSILELYKKKWAPDVIATYIIRTCISK